MKKANVTDRAAMVRISLDVTPQLKTIIDDLANKNGVPQAMLLRQAIALYKAIKDAQDKGESPALVDEQGKVTVRLLGI
jgi:predicted transcriptional regulator